MSTAEVLLALPFSSAVYFDGETGENGRIRIGVCQWDQYVSGSIDPLHR